MQPYQQRVVEEKRDLDEKRERLNKFQDGETFFDLDEEERIRLIRQLNAMDEYSEVLGERIAAWVDQENKDAHQEIMERITGVIG